MDYGVEACCITCTINGNGKNDTTWPPLELEIETPVLNYVRCCWTPWPYGPLGAYWCLLGPGTYWCLLGPRCGMVVLCPAAIVPPYLRGVVPAGHCAP